MHRMREDSSVIRCMNFLTMSGPQNSRHGEKIHAIATGREHRCSGWAGLHRRRSTACGLRKRGVNADAGSEFIAPSSQHPSHMPLHLERPGGAETVARQQAWSNSEPPMSGVLEAVDAGIVPLVFAHSGMAVVQVLGTRKELSRTAMTCVLLGECSVTYC